MITVCVWVCGRVYECVLTLSTWLETVTSSREVRKASRVPKLSPSIGSLVKKTWIVPLWVDRASNWPSSVQFSWSRPAGGQTEDWVTRSAQSYKISLDEQKDWATFGLIFQLNDTADVFEIRQLMDLYAAKEAQNVLFFLWQSKENFNSINAYQLSPQEAALFSEVETATLYRLSLWLRAW